MILVWTSGRELIHAKDDAGNEKIHYSMIGLIKYEDY
jgi:hypothetical protein